MNQLHKYRCALAAGLAAGMMLVVLMLGCPRIALSSTATNLAVDPGGGSVSLLPSGAVTVNSVQLSLVKQARDLFGNVLLTGATVTAGQTIYFVLYVDNTTAAPADDIQITDQLIKSEFAYTLNSIETTTVPSGSTDAQIWTGAAPGGWSSLTDAVGAPDDIASIIDSGVLPPGLDHLTVGAVAGQANQKLTIPGNTLRAVRFRVTVN